jgi:hypothetical protein
MPVATTHGNPRPAKESEANARLIAAAPELYRALADLFSIAADEGIVGDNTTMEAARAALAKARGEITEESGR